MIKWYEDKPINYDVEEISEKEEIVCDGCEACNYEGFYRDYDGSWLRDCYE